MFIIKDNLYDLCEGIEKYFQVNIFDDMVKMLQFDLIVGNEDRHTGNFGLVEKDGAFVFAPLFDHGLSLLSDTTSDQQYNDIEDIIYKPFMHARANGRGLDPVPIRSLKIDVAQFRCNADKIKNTDLYAKKTIARAFNVLDKSLEQTEGISWIH